MRTRVVPGVVLVFGPLLGFIGSAGGAITALWQPVTITPAAIANDPALVNMQCWDLKVNKDGNGTSAGMRAILPTGRFFYKHPLGGIFRPIPVLVAQSPALEFTTHLAFANEEFQCASVQGGFPEGPTSLGDSTSTLPGIFSATWGDLCPDAPGTYQIARVTFPLQVFPNVINIADVGPQGEFSRTSQVNPDLTTEIPDIPEPVGLSLVGLFACRLAARRSAPGQSH